MSPPTPFATIARHGLKAQRVGPKLLKFRRVDLDKFIDQARKRMMIKPTFDSSKMVEVQSDLFINIQKTYHPDNIVAVQ